MPRGREALLTDEAAATRREIAAPNPELFACSVEAAMTRVIATIRLKRTEEGGRATPISMSLYRATLFFENVPELRERGYDCRMAPVDATRSNWVSPGESVDEIILRFLSSDEALPHLRPRVRFSLWEGKTIGSGTVVRVDGSS
jgi:hypothetical protein